MNLRWTEEQATAITTPVDAMLSASAGTGKTTTVVGKILWSLGLVAGRRRETSAALPPCPDPCRLDQVAAITFTEKAAHDLQTKLRVAIEGAGGGTGLRWELDRAAVGTIHGFAAELLREHALRLDVDPTFRILDPRESEVQQAEVVRGILTAALRERDPGAIELTKRYGLTGWRLWPGAVDRVRDVMRDLRWRARQFDAWSVAVEGSRYTRSLDRAGLRERARFIGAWSDDVEERGRDDLSIELADALFRLGRASVHGWLSWLERENARDFDSLILDARRLLTRPETRAARDAIRSRFRLLIIDEFQDTDRAQWDIARALTGLGEEPATRPHERPQLLLVGDPKQSIYRFRGADIGVWNEARAAIEPSGRILELTWNFRCEPRVVAFVNRVGERALGETAIPTAETQPDSVVHYQALRAAREPTAAAGLEWIAVEHGSNADRLPEEARRVAGRLNELIGRAVVIDPEDGTPRRCRPSDVAILGRRNDDLAPLETGLRAYGLPFFNTATGGLSDQQEVLDLVTALRLLENPFDDLRAFAYLRSPFVGLRDEVLVRAGLWSPPGRDGDDHHVTLLGRAASFLDSVEGGRETWFGAPEGASVDAIERRALAVGLRAIADAGALADRTDHAELLEMLLDGTGYRLHLLLREGASERLANIERFLALLQEYRQLTLTRFLALWDRWGASDLGIPQARLYSSADDVITLSTIHAAKGLEWPVVVLVGTGARVAASGHLVGGFWSDPVLGPVFLPKQAERGPRAEEALRRRLAQESAEAARLLYVAATRARDRLLVVGPTARPGASYARWLGVELPDGVEAYEAAERAVAGPPAVGPPAEESIPLRPGGTRAVSHDAATGTGHQIDAFGEPARPQLDLFAGGGPDGMRVPEGVGPMVIRRNHPSAVQTSIAPLPVSLDWLEPVVATSWPAGIGELPSPESRTVASATERMLEASDPDAWRRRYVHGILGRAELLATGDASEPLSPRARGTVIHGVLERIVAADELARILDETIASLDLQELEQGLAPGSRYRQALEAEIDAVVRSPEWRWYVEGGHYRELRFLHRSATGWIQGAFDLLRPAEVVHGVPLAQTSLFQGSGSGFRGSGTGGTGESPGVAWVIDFKTHRIPADDVGRVAAEYGIQVGVYRAAVGALLEGDSSPARLVLHFTHPNVAIEV